MPDMGDRILPDLIYKHWNSLDTRKRNKRLHIDIQAILSLDNSCVFSETAIKKAIKEVKKRIVKEEAEERYNLAHEL